MNCDSRPHPPIPPPGTTETPPVPTPCPGPSRVLALPDLIIAPGAEHTPSALPFGIRTQRGMGRKLEEMRGRRVYPHGSAYLVSVFLYLRLAGCSPRGVYVVPVVCM